MMSTTAEITEQALASVRAVDGDTVLPDRCAIFRAKYTKDASGGRVADWRRIAFDVPCEVREPKALREGEVASRTTAQADMEIDLPYGTNVREKDRLQVGGQRYEIIGTNAGASGAIRLTCKCVRVK
jgi:SPP1 family predicted phage head-tail adaptor